MFWTTRDGFDILISDMTDSHIINSIDMLRRVAQKHKEIMILDAYAIMPSFGGEMAQLQIERDLEHLQALPLDVWLAKNENYLSLYAEAVRRGIF